MNFNSNGLGAVSILFAILGFVTTIFWLVVGWRAMRAHEQIADALRDKRLP